MSRLEFTRRRTLLLATAAIFAPAIANAAASNAALPVINVYRDPGCGCCESWAAALQQAGFPVTLENDSDMKSRKTQARVPEDLQSCHTAFMRNYVIEGHVPVFDIMRLVIEEPKILGLAVPGMPKGSLGMEAPGMKQHYNVWAFTAKGQRQVFSSY